MTATLEHPLELVRQLEAIAVDLAELQSEYAAAADAWVRAKAEREKAHALAFVRAEGAVAARSEQARAEVRHIGIEAEATFEAFKAVMRVLETRASVVQSLLKHDRETAT